MVMSKSIRGYRLGFGTSSSRSGTYIRFGEEQASKNQPQTTVDHVMFCFVKILNAGCLNCPIFCLPSWGLRAEICKIPTSCY